ncbi:hypothetical protein F1D05_09130 [Kribbella qitaiheensis]|uniref:UDP-N-acetylglucosamine kinase n=1 Tax=Kribbella qitaiheensis TaxID=1544730 RepID=A0A7G6WVK3_9ACTN|nr:zeta toxin family protein [Kribbella qitaiheensis]QNE18018.1 hypothetical protein F1D05_09130 [Kribbella qitaiheensis]
MSIREPEVERIFWEQIAPDELTGPRQDQPVVVFVVGQPGDGKAMISALARGVLDQRGQSVMISASRCSAYHPDLHALSGAEPTTVPSESANSATHRQDPGPDARDRGHGDRDLGHDDRDRDRGHGDRDMGHDDRNRGHGDRDMGHDDRDLRHDDRDRGQDDRELVPDDRDRGRDDDRDLKVDGRRWMAMAVSYVVSRGIDAVIELETDGLEELAGEFNADGYQVEVAIVAVPAAVSRFGVLERHVRALEAYGYGRFAEFSPDDFVVKTAEAVDRGAFADRVAVLRPDAHLVYGNERDSAGHWRRPANTAYAINWERDRPWTVLESRLFLEAVSALERTALAAPVAWIRREAMDGVKAINALAAHRLHPDAVTMHIATAGVSTPQY